jgi:glycine/D-amino acid oxidase-like deaminating enzyme
MTDTPSPDLATNRSAWWHDVSVAPRPPLDRDAEADVCVVGLGGSGLAAVREARALGARVIGLDAARIAGAAAGRNGGLLLGGMAAFHHDGVVQWGDAAVTLYHHTLDELARLRRETPDDTWWPGSLRVWEDERERVDCERQLSIMARDGLRVERYTGPEGDGLRFPDDGACHPVRRALSLARLAEAEGAVLHEESRVCAVHAGAVELANGACVRAPVVLVCADGTLATLLPAAADRLRAVRLQMLATAPADDVHIPRPVYARFGYDYWQQLPDGRVLLGGGRDRFEAEEYTAVDTPSANIQGWLEHRLRTRIGTAAPVTHRWAATVTYTTDELPVVEPFGEGLWGVGGYSGTGNVVGALCARGAVRRALGTPDAFLDTLDAARAYATHEFAARTLAARD